MLWRSNYRQVLAYIFTFLFLLAGFASGESREILRFEDGDTLEQLQQKIQHNGFEFQVGHNWVYDMPSEMKESFFSRHPPRKLSTSLGPVDMGPLAEKLSQEALPTQFDWRDYNGHSYIGPIRDQGNCGSCYAFGACAAAEGSYNLANGRYDSNCVDFSESYIIWCLGTKAEYSDHFFGCDGADYDYYELQALTKEGIVYESDFPYSESNPGSCTHWGDDTVVFDSWHRVGCNDIDAIKTAIMTYGVVDAAVQVTSAFQAYKGGVYEDSLTSCSSSPCYYTDTNHAIALVGWNDNGDALNKGYWILRNSWGSDWGENGYMRIKYKSARVACEAAYLVVGSACSVPSVPVSIVYPATDSDGSFTVSWTAVSGATSYTLERATDGSFTSGRVTLYTGSSTSYAQTGLASGTYYYRIKANNSCGSSSWRAGEPIIVGGGYSEFVNGETVSVSVASTEEKNYRINVPDGATKLEVSLTNVSGDPDLYTRFGLPPTTDNYDCRPYNGAGASETCTHDSPKPGYWYIMVRGYSSASADLQAAYSAPCVVPGAPASITYPASDSDGSFTVSWSTVSGATSYTLERATDGSFTSGRVTLYTGSSTSYAQTGLAGGTYYYRIKASNSCGSSSWRTGSLVTVGGGGMDTGDFYLIPRQKGGGTVIFLQ